MTRFMGVGKFSWCMGGRRYGVGKARDVVGILMCDMMAKKECSKLIYPRERAQTVSMLTYLLRDDTSPPL